ncbi:MAG: hypothetical protein KCHDKBKB_00021 [Elusimicrobia bacterium]|nr:hypothetical protein [Elusimicrobiota bacterium]
MKKFPLLFILLLAVPSPEFLWADPTVAIQTDLQPREITIGDPMVYQLTLVTSNDVAHKPFFFPEKLDSFELLAITSPTAHIGKDGRITTLYQFTLTTFSTGTLTIPSFPIEFSTLTSSAIAGQTDTMTIKVKSILEEKGDEGNLRPLKGLFNFKSYLWLWILIAFLICGGGGYFLWRWLNKNRKRDDGAPLRPPRPPEEVAWEAIHNLEDADLISSGQHKEFYYRLSVILREYLENRYGFSALDRTTAELMSEFRRQNFPLLLTQTSRNFFDNADLVKFAKFLPTEEEVIHDLNQVKHIINMTTVTQPPPAQEEVKL